MRIAAYQGEGVNGNVAQALDLMRETAAEAASRGASLVVFPEMFLTGYNIGYAVSSLAEPEAGPSATEAGRIAREAGLAVLCGYPERWQGELYNSAFLVDRSGKAVAGYRKTHLYGRVEKRWFKPGDSLVIAELNGLRIGILICYDVEFPEAVRALALAGAQLIAVPTALSQPFDMVSRSLVPTRAFENQVYIAYAGMCGSEGDLGYCGLSCIVGPDGKDLARAGSGPALLLADVDLVAISRARDASPYLSDRRPELYAAPVDLNRRIP
jgi:predicted amidohydrolase